jgi:hypothetical protein
VQPSVGFHTGPPRSIAVTIEGGDPDAHEYGGPATVAIDVTVDGMAVASETLVPEYERTFHRGDEKCGHCDRAEVELMVG